MSDKRRFLKKLYDIRFNGNDGYLSKNAVSNMIKREENIKIEAKDLKKIVSDLVAENLVEKTSNGIRITRYGMKEFEVVKKTKSKTKKVLFISGAVALVLLGCYLYTIYIR